MKTTTPSRATSPGRPALGTAFLWWARATAEVLVWLATLGGRAF